MRILLLHPNYHSGGAEIAGNWPPAWAAYITGALKKNGFADIRFIDAMTNDLSEDAIRDILRDEKPDVIGATAITPSIYKAERLLNIAKEIHPQAVTVLGGLLTSTLLNLVVLPALAARFGGPGEHDACKEAEALA